MKVVGIDWSRERHACYVNGERFIVEDSKEGYEELIKRVSGYKDVVFAIESRDQNITRYLVERGEKVYFVSPNRSASLRRYYHTSGKKDDFTDAEVLAKGVEKDPDIYPVIEFDEKGKELEALLSQYHMVTRMIAQNLNRINSILHKRCPELLKRLKRGGYSQPNALLYIYFGRIDKEIYRSEGIRVTKKFVKKVEGITLPEDRILKLIARQTLDLIKEKRKLTKELGECLVGFEKNDLFKSIPEMGPSTRAEVILSLKKRNYRSYRDFQAYGGTCPVTKKTGKKEYQVMRYSCNRELRDALHMFAFNTIKEVEWARAYYHKKREEGKTHGQALRALANIWIKIMFAMLKTNQLYHEEKYLMSRIRNSKSIRKSVEKELYFVRS